LAKDIRAEGKQRLFIPEEDGYRIFAPDDFQEVGPIVRYCAKVYQESRETFSAEYLQKHPTKKFLFPILEGVEFFRHPALLQLMVSRLFLDAAITYLGAVPRLAGARLCLWFLVFFWMRRLPILERFPGWLEQDCAGLLKMKQIGPVSSTILTMKI
jgi:hypothetical protein